MADFGGRAPFPGRSEGARMDFFGGSAQRREEIELKKFEEGLKYKLKRRALRECDELVRPLACGRGLAPAPLLR